MTLTDESGAEAPSSPLTDLFSSPELRPALRRLGQRPFSEEAAGTQAAVWATLAESGAISETHDVLPVCELLGETLYRGPYLDTVTALDAFAALPATPETEDLVDALRHGDLAVALAGPDRRFVRCADQADLLLTVDEERFSLMELDDPNIRLREHEDLGRGGLFTVTAPPDTPLVATGRLADPTTVFSRSHSRQAAYLTGLCRGALDLGVTHARRRILFGAPLGSHQHPAFRLAALSARLEAVRSLLYRGDRPNQALGLAKELAVDTTTEVLQLHGASGLLDEDDAQLFYRRALTESVL
ncbi:acyl-CoA dehydrogenase family protein [Streptomyces sp. NPDC006450]|uniref:acyl-CoA dehydrogenase family protein n=1 Tax=Streptomyces sp. NPDC006450 TaxID=3155458 RepID=UPI0033B26ECB